MRNYRLYFVDLISGDVKDHREFEAENDSVATIEADRLRGIAPMELWCRARRIAKWPALL
jgi:hypothetical protein